MREVMMLDAVAHIPTDEDRAPHDPTSEFALAKSARFDATLRRFVVLLSNGATFRLDVDLVEVLQGLSDEDLSGVDVGHDGRSLIWPAASVSLPIGDFIDGTTRLGLDVETLPKPLGMIVMQPLYCCPACETVMGTCKRFKSNTYGAKTEDYSYDGE
jgi:hypothetical protein